MPLNPTLRAQLPADVRALYDSGVRVTTYGISERFIASIQNVRRAHQLGVRDSWGRINHTFTDPLAERARLYGATVGAYARELARRLARRLFEHKIPENTGDRSWRTIEFECLFPNAAKYAEFQSKVRAAGLMNQTTITEDGSVSDYRNNPNAVDKEVVFTFRKGNEASVRKICAIFAECGAYVNQSCGTHVHFDMRGLSEADVTLKAERVAKYVPILRRMLPSARRSNNYCAEIINTMHRGGRYAFVNLQAFPKHGTLEIRGHSGTLNASKILNWISICDALMNVRVRATFEVSTVLDLAMLYKLDRSLANYMVAREAKFTDATADEAEGMRAAA